MCEFVDYSRKKHTHTRIPKIFVTFILKISQMIVSMKSDGKKRKRINHTIKLLADHSRIQMWAVVYKALTFRTHAIFEY